MDLPKPLCRLHLHDLSHKGTASFLSAVDAATIVEQAIATVLRLLYKIEPRGLSADSASQLQQQPESSSTSVPSATALPGPSSFPIPQSNGDGSSTAPVPPPSQQLFPPVRSITLLLRHIDGVGYTTGKEIDDEHKEIHLSLSYVATRDPALLKAEMTGFLVHEMTHVWQWNGMGTCNGGLIEGIADWVRLRAGLAPPHWSRRRGQRWDQGYETTGYFLDWLETVKCGEGTVRRLNRWLMTRKYDENKIWEEICEAKVDILWDEYEDWVEKHGLFKD